MTLGELVDKLNAMLASGEADPDMPVIAGKNDMNSWEPAYDAVVVDGDDPAVYIILD